MIPSEVYALGASGNPIREIADYAMRRAEEVGAENVYDFSIGNPNVPAPEAVKTAIIDILNTVDTCELHGYTIAPGLSQVRETIAASINRRFGTNFAGKNLFMTLSLIHI